MSFGDKALDGAAKVQDRLPDNLWAIPPDITEATEITKLVGDLEAEIELLEFQIKSADTKAKKDSPRKVYERFEVTEHLEKKLADKKANLARAKAAERIIVRHTTIFVAYLYAIGKVF